MITMDKIQEKIQKLPPALQAEVLDFVEYLQLKAERNKAQHVEDDRWGGISLALAMRGMEQEETPDYTIS